MAAQPAPALIEPAPRRVLLVGAGGVFGRRLAQRLAAWPQVALVLAGRREAPLQALAVALGGVRTAVFDRRAPGALGELAPFAVIDCAGPFQAADYGLAHAALACGAHYLDIADARAFVASFPEALDAQARAAGLTAVTGCSSTPALTHAVLDRLTAGWTRIDRVEAAISPGAQAPRGLSVVAAILSWVGRPVRVFRQGAWGARPGWSGLRREAFPGVGWRWTALAETPDLDQLPARFRPRRAAEFRAGLASPVLHFGLWLLAWPVRWRLLGSLRPFARPLAALAGPLAGFASDRGGMVVLAEGAGPDGTRRLARWSLAAAAGAGPETPVAPAAAMLRRLLAGEATSSGATVCAGRLDLAEILRELPSDKFRYATRSAAPDRLELLPAVLGEDFAALPPAVRQAHAGDASAVWRGLARARRGRGLAALIATLFGLPPSGRYADFFAALTVGAGREQWTRGFGRARFRSTLRRDPDPLRFREQIGPLVFRFDPEITACGFRWRLIGWSAAGLSLPLALAPRARAFTHGQDGVYRFHVVIGLPLLGLLCAYAGRLTAKDPA